MSRIIQTKSIYDEPKTSQMSLRLGDRLKCDLEKIATMNRTNLTDVAVTALIEYAKEHITDIQYYNKVFGNKEEVKVSER